MSSEWIAVSVMVIGAAVAVMGVQSRSPHRLSLLLLAAALIVGPLAFLFSNYRLQQAASVIAIGCALVVIANAGAAVLRRARDIRQ